MAAESLLQGKVIRWLKSKGCTVLNLSPMPGVPSGFPDVLALMDGGGWIALEIKASKSARFQPLQKEWLKKLDGMYYARVVHPENWDDIKRELDTMI